jgi:hypothetical protein
MFHRLSQHSRVARPVAASDLETELLKVSWKGDVPLVKMQMEIAYKSRLSELSLSASHLMFEAKSKNIAPPQNI